MQHYSFIPRFFTTLQIHAAGITFLIGLAITLALFWFFWPKKGGLALIKQLSSNNKRVIVEDALKFIYDCEYNQMNCEVNRIAEHLSMSGDHTNRLIDRLGSMGLVQLFNQSVTLTDTGRSYALRVVRTHRIWEKYLADQTSLSPVDWHNEADRIEHLVTAAETEELAAKMGHPVFDPHGDPIPSANGEMPKLKGAPLDTMQVGDIGQITHLEDEPKSTFEQLLVLGLYPGMQIYITEISDKKVSFVAEGEECVLTPLFAGSITVEKLEKDRIESTKHELLSSLKIGDKAEVVGISPNCRGQQRRRLMDLGIVPGSKIAAVMKSASGDPVGYRVLGTTVGIRKQHANQVYINPEN